MLRLKWLFSAEYDKDPTSISKVISLNVWPRSFNFARLTAIDVKMMHIERSI